MNVNFSFNAHNIAPMTAYEPIPEGFYKAIIESHEIKPTAKGDGGFVALKINIAEGEFKGRSIFYRLNLWNPNEKAVEIAQKQLSSICHATGVFILSSLADFNNFRNIPFVVKLVIKTDKGDKGDIVSNEIKLITKDDGSQSLGQTGSSINSGVSGFAPQQPVAAAPVQAWPQAPQQPVAAAPVQAWPQAPQQPVAAAPVQAWPQAPQQPVAAAPVQAWVQQPSADQRPPWAQSK
jgi:hypothetical protein